MRDINRIIVIVLDSLGIGAMPDADKFGDEGAATLPHLAEVVDGLEVPNLEKLGLGNIVEIEGVAPQKDPAAAFGYMKEQSPGKDTTQGHWEIAGMISKNQFPTYPEGFPPEIINQFKEAIGRECLGNRPASGTVIIEELGAKHLESGKPIVYTSADSVFQIAAHEEVIPVKDLYKMCKKARAILTGEHAVSRVIARPFVGELGDFNRTSRRKDFSLKPSRDTVLDLLKRAGKDVIAVGKIKSIFAAQGITEGISTKDNEDGINKTLEVLNQESSGLIFTNLVDFDQNYGHRRNPEGYARALYNFDKRLPEIKSGLGDDELLIITADHGCDPTYKGTDHTREYVPLLVWGEEVRAGVDLGCRETFADIGATIADILEIKGEIDGISFRNQIIGR